MIEPQVLQSSRSRLRGSFDDESADRSRLRYGFDDEGAPEPAPVTYPSHSKRSGRKSQKGHEE